METTCFDIAVVPASLYHFDGADDRGDQICAEIYYKCVKHESRDQGHRQSAGEQERGADYEHGVAVSIAEDWESALLRFFSGALPRGEEQGGDPRTGSANEARRNSAISAYFTERKLSTPYLAP